MPAPALILFAHGARDPRWGEALALLRGALLRAAPARRIEIAFLELQTPDLPHTLAALASEGYHRIDIAPIFWARGGHVARDLPALVQACTSAQPQLRVRVLPVLAELPGMNDFVTSALLAAADAPDPPAGPSGAPADGSAARDAAFVVAPFLREIGRGKDGARALPRERARALMRAILDGQVDDLALGGVLLALRMKGETAGEIAGFLDALEPHLLRAPARSPGWVVIPSYNGARSVANLVPLLALLLARAGLPVLVHGQASEPSHAPRMRVSSADIFSALGVAPCPDVRAAGARAAAGEPVMAPLQGFAPALARLIALRPQLGVRNVAHTLVKLLRPVQGPSLLVSSYTHPAFGQLQAELFASTGAHAMSLRGTDGEAVVSARRAQAIELWRDGQCRTVTPAQAVAAAVTGLPAADAQATAQWTRAVLDGQEPVPAAVAAQVAAVRAAMER